MLVLVLDNFFKLKKIRLKTMAEHQSTRISAKDVDQQHLVKALAAFLKK